MKKVHGAQLREENMEEQERGVSSCKVSRKRKRLIDRFSGGACCFIFFKLQTTSGACEWAEKMPVVLLGVSSYDNPVFLL